MLIPLMRLARSKDIRVQRCAVGVLVDMTWLGMPTYPNWSRDQLIGLDSALWKWRRKLVDAGIIPLLVELLGSPDSTTCGSGSWGLWNIALDGKSIPPSILSGRGSLLGVRCKFGGTYAA